MPEEFSHPHEQDAPAEHSPLSGGEHPAEDAEKCIHDAKSDGENHQKALENADIWKTMLHSTRIPEERPSLESEPKDVYGFTYTHTLNVLDRKIDHANVLFQQAKHDVENVSWGKRLESTFKLGGLLGATSREVDELGLKQQGDALRNLKQKRVDFTQEFRANSYEKLSDLKAFRLKLGLPGLPREVAGDYETFMKSVREGQQKKEAGLEVSWLDLNKKLQQAEGVLDGWETVLQTVDTGTGIVAGFVPYGSEVYELSRSCTSVAIGTMTPEQAAKEFIFGVLSARVGGKAMSKLKMGEVMETWVKKNQKYFTSKTAEALARVTGAGATGAVQGAVTGGLDGTMHAVYDVNLEGKALEDAIDEALRRATIGAVFGGAVGAAGKGIQIRGEAKARQKAQQMVEDNLRIPDTDEGRGLRKQKAQDVLGKELPPKQQDAVLAAHDVQMSNSKEYSGPELRQKMRILIGSGISIDDAAKLLRFGVCGTPQPHPKIPAPPLPHSNKSAVPKNPTVKPAPSPPIIKPQVTPGAPPPLGKINVKPAPSPPPMRPQTTPEQGLRISKPLLTNGDIQKIKTANKADWTMQFKGTRYSYDVEGNILSIGGADFLHPDEERLLLNALHKQKDIARMLGISDEMAFKEVQITSDGPLMSDKGNVNRNSLRHQIEYIKNNGATEEDIVNELAGHIFHESIHQISDHPTARKQLFDQGESEGEVTTITSQLGFYFSQNYFLNPSYSPARMTEGILKLRLGKNSVLDYEIAACLGYEFMFTRLKKAFPERVEYIQSLSVPAACETLVRYGQSQPEKLVKALKSAMKDSGDIQIIKETMKKVRETRAIDISTLKMGDIFTSRSSVAIDGTFIPDGDYRVMQNGRIKGSDMEYASPLLENSVVSLSQQGITLLGNPIPVDNYLVVYSRDQFGKYIPALISLKNPDVQYSIDFTSTQLHLVEAE